MTVGVIIYILSILWINFHSRQWYTFDIYSDSLLARIMVEQKTIFPDNWVFGNQYYVVATPVLASLVYALCHNSVISLAVASSVMMALILCNYLWAVKPFISKRERLGGLFCLSGAIILGNSASSYANGMEYFYTMASFYACYVLTILFTLGVYFRLRTEKKISLLGFIISFLLSFALGMQSLRGTLVLYLPLLAFTMLAWIIQRSERKVVIYSGALLVVNIMGIVIMKFIPVKSSPIISSVSLTLNVHELFRNLKITTIEFLKITGLWFGTYGMKWSLLFLISLFILGVVNLSIIGVMRNKNHSVIKDAIIFFSISICAVFVVGVFLFRVRAIYFFCWYLLVMFSFIYVVMEYRIISQHIMICLCLAGTVNYVMNFIPDFMSFNGRENFYQEVTDQLIDEGIECVYYDPHTSPLIAVYSDDQIISGTVQLDPDEKSGRLMYPVNCLQPIDVFKNAEQYNSYIALSNWTFAYLKANASDEYVQRLMDRLEYVRQVSYQGEELTFYRFSPEILSYSDY